MHTHETILVLGRLPRPRLEELAGWARRRMLVVDLEAPELKLAGVQVLQADPMSYASSRLENHEKKRATTLEHFDLVIVGDVRDLKVAARFAALAGRECILWGAS